MTPARRPVFGVVGGPVGLGVLGRYWQVSATLRLISSKGWLARPLALGNPDSLHELWDADVVVMCCDGVYPEVGGGISLSALQQWCAAGGILLEVAASPFLLASTGGIFEPSARWYTDVFGLLIESNGTDQLVEVTPAGASVLGELPLPATLAELNRGSDLRTVLSGVPGADVELVRSGTGACILGEYIIGRGRTIRWAASACGPWIERIQQALLELAAARCNPSRSRRPPAAVVGSITTVGGWLADRADGGSDACTGSRSERALTWVFADAEFAANGARFDVTGADGALPTGHVRARAAHLVEVELLEPLGLAGDVVVSLEGDDKIAALVQPAARSYLRKEFGVPDSPVTPTDFAEFWARQASVMPYSWALDKAGHLGARSPLVEITGCVCRAQDQVSSGLLARSRGLQSPAPAVLVLPGYQCSAEDDVPEWLAEHGMVAMSIGFGDVPSCGAAASAQGLLSEHPDDPERFGYVRVVLMCLAALQWLSRRPEVDPRRIAVLGGSQGGGLALLTAAVDSRVAAVVSLVPFLCDIVRSQASVMTHPYAELRAWFEAHPDRRVAAFDALQYFDGCNAASRITVPTLILHSARDEIVHPDAICELVSRFPTAPDELHAGEGHVAPALLHWREQILSWLCRRLEIGPEGSSPSTNPSL